MRRLPIILIGGALWLLLAAIPAMADGGPHVMTSNNGTGGIRADGCAGCHRIHTSQSPTGYLLVTNESTITNYCRSCHGATGTGAATDVDTGLQYALDGIDRDTGTVVGALRSGGFIQARIGADAAYRLVSNTGSVTQSKVPVAPAAQDVTSAHLAIGGAGGNGLTAKNVVWGNGALGTAGAGPTLASEMECTACHNPHGNGNYRLLRPDPQQRAGVAGVTVSDPGGIAYTTANYWDTYRTDPASGPTAVNMSSWCSQCHTRYLTSASTDSGDAIFKFRHKSNGADSYAAKAGSPYFSATANPSYKDSCLQCHVSHGSNVVMGANSQGVPNPGSSSGRGTDSSLLKIDNRGTCVACHGTTP